MVEGEEWRVKGTYLGGTHVFVTGVPRSEEALPPKPPGSQGTPPPPKAP